MTYDYDICFIGGGLNYAGAIIAARGGLKTALVERNMAHLGGTCLHNGCIPSKMYLEAAHTVLKAASQDHFIGSVTLDMARLHEKKETLLANVTTSITKQCRGVDLIAGEGKLVAPHTVEVEEKRYTAKYIIIGTGASPFVPEGIVYDKTHIITSDDVLNLTALPQKIAVYGDGAIGLEMASFFAAAGVETELIWRHDTLLRQAHPVISKNIKSQMEALGIRLRPQSSIASAKRTEKRGVHIRFQDGSEHYVPTLLVATGRRANTETVQADAIAVDTKGIRTDEHFETTLAKHYAVGDCNGKLQLAHAARAEVLHVVRRILGKQSDRLTLDKVVKFIHTLPCSYAQVGKTKATLEKEEMDYTESVVPLKGLPFAHTHEGDLGVMALYADSEGFVLGGEIFAPYAEEL
ncbi:MAG: NAD(P)/FAD-dependent oxidoreductase, partial [Sulfurovum sp.]|nr:NAD(P)/FAD-dependent oxidoreductase [Sulfurovum sp.]